MIYQSTFQFCQIYIYGNVCCSLLRRDASYKLIKIREAVQLVVKSLKKIDSIRDLVKNFMK